MVDRNFIAFAAGSVSSVLFMSSALPMLAKAYRTRNMNSYSAWNILLSNLGNLVYWLYVFSLPFGPIWVMHAFYTLTSAFMLAWYFRLRAQGC